MLEEKILSTATYRTNSRRTRRFAAPWPCALRATTSKSSPRAAHLAAASLATSQSSRTTRRTPSTQLTLCLEESWAVCPSPTGSCRAAKSASAPSSPSARSRHQNRLSTSALSRISANTLYYLELRPMCHLCMYLSCFRL